jgi:hypothetical protein
MRSVRSGLWLFVFVLGAALPAFCQPIVPPNTSGFRIFSDTTKALFEQNVYSTGPFDFFLAVFQNTQLKFATSGTVCTSGPFTTVDVPIPFNSMTLKTGDVMTFMFGVRHRTTEGGSGSLVVSAIPVGPPFNTSSTPSGPTTPTQSKVGPADRERVAPWARREESPLA